MEKFSTDGVILKVTPTGEADLVAFILTRERGLIRAFIKGAKKTNSRLHSASAQFTYAVFDFYENKGVFHVNDATVKEVFFELRSDLRALTLAQYFCEILLKNTPEEKSEPEALRLLLNSLSLICKKKKPELLVKAVFELRILMISGYMPALIACEGCSRYETPQMYFDCLNGSLFCEECGRYRNLPEIPLAVVSAMRFIVFSEFEKCFSFELTDALIGTLNRLTEKYTQNCFQQTFRLLDYFYQYSDIID